VTDDDTECPFASETGVFCGVFIPAPVTRDGRARIVAAVGSIPESVYVFIVSFISLCRINSIATRGETPFNVRNI